MPSRKGSLTKERTSLWCHQLQLQEIGETNSAQPIKVRIQDLSAALEDSLATWSWHHELFLGFLQFFFWDLCILIILFKDFSSLDSQRNHTGDFFRNSFSDSFKISCLDFFWNSFWESLKISLLSWSILEIFVTNSFKIPQWFLLRNRNSKKSLRNSFRDSS